MDTVQKIPNNEIEALVSEIAASAAESAQLDLELKALEEGVYSAAEMIRGVEHETKTDIDMAIDQLAGAAKGLA